MILILALSAIPALSETPDRSWGEIKSALENDIIPYSLIGEDMTKGLTHAELSALAVRLFEAFWQTQELRGGTFGRGPYAYLPQMILENVVSIHAGDRLGAAIQADGTVWTWGWNEYGRLGNGGAFNTNATDDNHSPCQTFPLPITDNAAAVSSGYRYHMAILKKDGTVWMCGQGYADVPTRMNIDHVVAITVGELNTYALKGDGTLWQWGKAASDMTEATQVTGFTR